MHLKHLRSVGLATLLVATALMSGCPTPVPDDTGIEADGGMDTGARDTGRDAPMNDTPPEPACGDGTVDDGETCDDGNAMSDDGCDATCLPEAGWSCDGASPTVCSPVCGDGTVRGDEAGASGCDDANTTSGDGCAADCTVEAGFSCAGEPSSCMTGCGDGIVAGTEDCDDGNSADADGCSAACVVETGWECAGSPSSCTEVGVCGDGVVAPTEPCDDGNTEVGDGCSDVCALEEGATCTGEPSVCTAVCGDGFRAIDEQCDDGNTVSFDGCHANCRSESEIEPNEDGTPSIGGSGPQGNDFDATAVANADANGAISEGWLMSAAFGVAGDEDVFAYENTSPIDQSVTFAIFEDASGTCATLDPSLTLRDAAGVQLARDDNSGPGRCSLLTYVVPVGATVYVHVTEFGDNGTGAYVLSISLCTDGILGASEICDDGNTTNGDSCDNNCTVSACGNGIVAGSESCDDGNLTNGDGCDSNCVPTGCGNGVTGPGEVCDDGNLINGDGCDGNCTPTGCGNGAVSSGESCDDGNLTSGDGCDSNCTVTGCGNGIRTGTEICDDGNAIDGDGCDNDCDIGSTCGNGVLNAGETCDDGARVAADGCSTLCQTETGYACTGAPSSCAAICGDRIVVGPEICDDGNTVGGDACEADCRSSLCLGADREPNGTRATASCLAVAALGTGSVDPTGDQDFWTFTLSRNSDVRVETFDASGTACATMDTVIDLYRADGTRILTDDNDGPGNCSLIDPTLAADAAAVNLAAATYFVRVRHFSVDGTGDYTLRVTATPGPVCGDGMVGRGEFCDDSNTVNGDGCSSTCWLEPVESEPNEDGMTMPSTSFPGTVGNDFGIATAGGPYSASVRISAGLFPAGDEDVFAFTNSTAAAVSVVFETYTTVAGLCPSGDTGLHIRNAAGMSLASDDDSGDGACSRVTYSIPAMTTVYAHVTEYSDDGTIAFYFLNATFP